MALWGNNDNVGSAGTVILDYSTGVVTGAGTSFGIAGGCSEGDIIRFGSRGSGGTYFGDAVIVSIASSESLTIGSTAGLSGAAISAANFFVSQLPKSSVLNTTFDRARRSAPSQVTLTTTADATGVAGIGSDIIPVAASDIVNALGNDALVNDSNSIKIASVTATQISLASTISAGISTGDTLTFKRTQGGYDSLNYAIGGGESDKQSGTSFESGVGWVGVTTYIDNSGTVRVKKEILVAMSGISTGTHEGGILYPTNE